MRARRPGRAHLAALAAASLLGAAAAGTATGTSTEPAPAAAAELRHDAADTADSIDTGPAVTDEPLRFATADDRTVRSAARQILLDQGRPADLTDVDLVARDVLSAGTVGADEVDRLTREALGGAGPSAPDAHGAPAPPQCPPTARACIDVDGKRAWMVDDGRITYGPVPVTTGRPGYETARGTHRVLRHVRHDHSRIFDSPMPYSTYFTRGGMAFHEGRLDEPSHGCIHLGHHAAAHFFEQLRVGDEIVAF